MASAQGSLVRPDAGASQAAVIDFLSDPKAYTPVPAEVERIATHAAIIFLAGGEAYKIKQAVKHSYLDFSTLEQRRIACLHELEVNRANAPGIYLGVVPITRNTDGGLSIGGSGAVLEWTVHMRRFETGELLSNLYAHAPPSDQSARYLAQAVAMLHQRAEQAITRDGAGRIAEIIEELRSEFKGLAGRLPAGATTAFIELAHRELEHVRMRLNLRARRGRVRRCHGDLHLGNIVEIEGKPVLFDAIEFDDRMATTDVLYDIAFLIMDLDVRGYRRAANLLLNRYLTLSRRDIDLYGLGAMPLFLALRAAIRCMVALQRPKDGPGSRDDEALSYLKHAQGYLAPNSPRLIAVGGCSGTGKSTLARGLAPAFGRAPGAIHLSSDVIRKQLAGVPESEHIEAASYTGQVSAAVHERLRTAAARILRAGYSVVVDATFLQAEERAMMAVLARRWHVPFAGFWLAAPKPVAQARVRARRADVSDATADVVERQFATVAPPRDWIAIDSSGTEDQTLAAVRQRLSDVNAAS